MADPITLLTALALTPEAELGSFKERYLASHRAADVERLRDARALLDAIGDALQAPDDQARWDALRAARSALPAAAVAVPREGTGTVALPDDAGAGGATLPFSPAATIATAPAHGRQTPSGASGTLAVANAPTPAAALPFGARELTVETYAALCAESALAPSRTSEINERYGLGAPGARGRVDLAWQKRLAADAGLRERWRALFEDLKRRGAG